MRFNLKLEEIKYLKILYTDIYDEICDLKVAIKKIDEREIFACAKTNTELNIETPQEIMLSIVCTDGLYRTKAKLKSINNEDPYTFIYIETPQGIEYQQNREYFRVKANYNCFYIPDENSAGFEVISNDISANGISLIMPNHIISENASKLLIEINKREIETLVKYIRSEKVENGYKISFTFSKISENDRDFISQVCIKNQLAQRRNTLF